MLPKKLSIQGLYSYQNKAIIDFENLTSAGLFGIFGAVGSGKSSILEAIGFALYGQTERLGSKEMRAYNMMNLKSNQLHIEFEFENYDGKLYRFEAKARRNSKRFEDVGTIERSAFIWENENWLPLDSVDAEKYIHLSYENFRRTVIIPQGKFQEFLQLTASERTKMLLDIFQLERFDLSDNINKISADNKDKLAQKTGALSQYEEKNETQLNALQSQSDIIVKEIQDKTEIQKKKLNEVNILLEISKIFDGLHQTTNELEKLQSQTTEFNRREQALKVYEDAKYNFENLLLNRKSILDKITQRKDQIQHLSTQLCSIQNKEKQLLHDFLPLKIDFEKLDDERKKLHEFDFIINIQSNISEVAHQNNRREKGQKLVDDKFKEAQSISSIIHELEIQINELENKANHLDTLFEIKSWWDSRIALENDLKQLNHKIDIGKTDLLAIELEFEKLGYTVSDWQNSITKQRQDLDILGLENQQKLNQITVQEKLQDYATNLEEGTPCPLCGATHHPEILVADNISQHLVLIKANETEWNRKVDTLKLTENQLNKISNSYKIQEGVQSQNVIELKKKAEILTKHLAGFSWKSFENKDFDTFQSLFENAKKSNENLKQKRTEIDRQKTISEKLNKDLQAYQLEIGNIEGKLENLQAQIKLDQNRLTLLNWNDFSEKSVDVLNSEKENLDRKIAQTIIDFNSFTDQIKSNETALTKAQSDLTNQQNELGQNKKESARIISQIQSKLEDSSFTAIEEVETILQKSLAIESERKEIDEYKKSLHALESKFEDLKKQTDGKHFDQVDLEILQNQLKELDEKISHLQSEFGSISGHIKSLSEELKIKENLAKEVEKLQFRQDNINTMFNLFKGQGFVNYISTVYLQQLCQAANKRFYQLTNNHLQLDLNEKNEFIVIDFMNEGRYRSVKTLSGGQTFQAALCLALALADSVQANKSDQQNFFFLDEGFGSLDKNSLNIVFETLKSLRKENRIVGVISHVEDLQQEIPLSLLVQNDAETGSYLTINND